MAFLLRNFISDQIPNEKFILYFFIASSAYLTSKLMSVAVLYCRRSSQISLLIKAASSKKYCNLLSRESDKTLIKIYGN